MPPVTNAQFLADNPAFDTSLVTDPEKVQISPAAITFWLKIAFVMLNPNRWPDPDVYAMGQEQFAAHHVILEVLAQRDMDVGGVPGVATGVVAGKTAGDVSIAYFPGATIELDAGHWNFTVYGQRFIRLARMMGAGPIQVNTPGCGTYGGAWPGPFPWPTPE